MSIILRSVLIVASVLNCLWVLIQIRKVRIRVADSVFWILFSALLLFISLFPQVPEWGARVLGVQSPVNFIFLAIIFILLLKLFRMTIKVSQLESKLVHLAQTYAIDVGVLVEEAVINGSGTNGNG